MTKKTIPSNTTVKFKYFSILLLGVFSSLLLSNPEAQARLKERPKLSSPTTEVLTELKALFSQSHLDLWIAKKDTRALQQSFKNKSSKTPSLLPNSSKPYFTHAVRDPKFKAGLKSVFLKLKALDSSESAQTISDFHEYVIDELQLLQKKGLATSPPPIVKQKRAPRKRSSKNSFQLTRAMGGFMVNRKESHRNHDRLAKKIEVLVPVGQFNIKDFVHQVKSLNTKFYIYCPSLPEDFSIVIKNDDFNKSTQFIYIDGTAFIDLFKGLEGLTIEAGQRGFLITYRPSI